MKARTLVLGGVFLAFGAIVTMAEGASYFGQFQALERARTPGWNRDPSLVDTNNAGPSLTGRLIASRPLLERGEFAGIRLGMTMSEVVAEWGKPPWVTGVCGIGRRFHYGQGINLVFREDRLVVLGLTGAQLRRVTFDNAFSVNTTRDEVESVLGLSAARVPDDGFYDGEVRFETHSTRVDMTWTRSGTSDATHQVLGWLAVRLLGAGELRHAGDQVRQGANQARQATAASRLDSERPR